MGLIRRQFYLSFNDISEGKSPTSISGGITIDNCYLPHRNTKGIHAITKIKLQGDSKSPSEVVNIAAPKVMI